jgi:hypothetical protein
MKAARVKAQTAESRRHTRLNMVERERALPI